DRRDRACGDRRAQGRRARSPPVAGTPRRRRPGARDTPRARAPRPAAHRPPGRRRRRAATGTRSPEVLLDRPPRDDQVQPRQPGGRYRGRAAGSDVTVHFESLSFGTWSGATTTLRVLQLTRAVAPRRRSSVRRIIA